MAEHDQNLASGQAEEREASRRRRREKWRRIRGTLVIPVIRLVQWAFRLLTWKGAQRAGRVLALLSWPATGGVRRRIKKHLGMAFTELGQEETRRLARRVLAHLGTTLGELLYLSTRGCRHLRPRVRTEGWEQVEELWKSKQPFLFVTGHCGNWEMLAATASCLGVPVYGFARGTEDPQLQGLLLEFRERFGSSTIARGEAGSARKILKVLRRHEGAMGILIDQDTRVEGVWVPFFGRPAFTPVGAAELALKQKMQVVPTFIEREEDGGHLARFLRPVELPPDPEAATALLTQVIEDQIRRRPEQWVWSHRRWRRQPSS